MADSRHVENRQIAISRDDIERVSQAYWSYVRHLGFLKLNVLTGDALETHALRHRAKFYRDIAEISHFFAFIVKCIHSLDTHTHTRLTAFFRDYPDEPVPER